MFSLHYDVVVSFEKLDHSNGSMDKYEFYIYSWPLVKLLVSYLIFLKRAILICQTSRRADKANFHARFGCSIYTPNHMSRIKLYSPPLSDIITFLNTSSGKHVYIIPLAVIYGKYLDRFQAG